jgi:glycosyltransferase involved in cell wall biosynthesis
MIRLHGEIETPLPLLAQDGVVTLSGWCLIAGAAQPPAMRLAHPGGVLPQTDRHDRTDVPRLLPSEPAAARCGFRLTGRLPAGVHPVSIEAAGPDGSWHRLRELCVAVPARPLQAGVETPAIDGRYEERIHLEGWALHPAQPVAALTLRYGHQEIPCELGRPRPDLAAVHPGVPHAATAGFKSRTNLSAGLGPLRIRARLADGSPAVVRTELTVKVPADENHPPGLDWAAPRVPLPVHPPATLPGPEPARTPLNILFLLPGSFASNNALHVAGLANELAAAGHRCAAAVAREADTLAHHRTPAFRGLTHAEAAGGVAFPDGRGPDVIHAWTTRENVRRLAESLRQRHRARLVVHLEDNEQQLLALSVGRPFAELNALGESELDALVPDDLSHPHRSRAFLAGADGITIITGQLADFVPPGRPHLTLTPAADARFFFPRPVPREFRAALQLPDDTTVLFYHGNVHAANAGEVRALYEAVLRLNEAGERTLLLRTGLDRLDFLGPLAPRVRPHVLALGQILHHRHLPPLMALADCFVQPGEPDPFNDYRFPSKLPEFFALGRPVILPRTNLGRQLRHGHDAYVLDRADAAGIARAVTELRRDPALRDRLARGAVACSRALFDWRRSAAALANFYASLPS